VLRSRDYDNARQIVRTPQGGGAGRLGVIVVVIGCQFDDITGELYVTGSRLLSPPYGYDPDPPSADKFEGTWGGVEPLIIPDMLAVLIPVVPPPGKTDIKWVCMPILSADRTQLNAPSIECLTEFGEACAGNLDPDLCN